MAVKLHQFYDLLPDPEVEDGWCVRLKNCDFAGIKYRYGKFKIEEPTDGSGHARCIFDYNVIEVPRALEEKVFPDEKQTELNHLMGDIVIELLEEYYEDKEQREQGDVDITVDLVEEDS